MILDFRGKEYVCRYFTGNKYVDTICFSDGYFKKIYNNYVYSTYIWPKEDQDQRNYCPFDKKTLLEYFIEISKILGFKLISLSETEHLYKLQIKCAPDRRYFIYVSMCIRYVYEHPFAFYLYAAWQNKHNFPELDIIQIMQFYLAVVFNGARCHCPGESNFTFYNINSKCQFSNIRNDFNNVENFYLLRTNHIHLDNILYQINTKQLPQIASGINFIVNKYYDENKKSICRW